MKAFPGLHCPKGRFKRVCRSFTFLEIDTLPADKGHTGADPAGFALFVKSSIAGEGR